MTDAPFTPLVLTATDGAHATVLPYGAHVVGWTPAPATPGGGDERLFVSARAEYRAGAAVRGGVPVIFPQFGDRVAGPGPSIRHGFARTRPWRVVRAAHASDGTAEAVLALADADLDAETRARWPHPFRAELTVRVAGAALALTLEVENTGVAPLPFTAALHTYLRVGDAARARVRGLEAAAGSDTAAGGAPLAPAGAPLGFGGEVDHLYVHVPGPVTLDDPALGRATRVDQTGFRDVVVWNPGPVRGASLADLEPDGWRRFVCVEAAAAGEPVVVAPGGRWAGAQRLTSGPLDA
ncbi:D-hexose-6-phosphate mutarotase [Gemmatimonadetes bacterium T265]|nr:D-hexose-6-phosphate mutarotase [Gemmatimonadetes bacterium T265]